MMKDNLIKCKCLSYNINHLNKIDEELKKRFKNTFKFSNNDINKFILLLKKIFVLMSYEYMDDWEKFNKTSLNIDDITDVDYMHVKRICKDFERKDLGECHDLYLKSDTLLFIDVFVNFRKMRLKIYY